MVISGPTLVTDLWDRDILADAPAAFRPFREAAAAFAACATWPTLEDYNRLARSRELTTAVGVPLVFVPAAPKPRGRDRKAQALSYEERVFTHGEVATRAGSWHDYFNVLAWVAFPKAKGAMNRRQKEAGGAGVGRRSHEQNRLAMMDEGGMVGGGGEVWVVGHALGEAYVRGQRDVYGLFVDVEVPRDIDERLAAVIAAGALATKDRMPSIRLGDLR